MSELLLATISAFWLGVLTSISPCPLATNIAAISYVGQRVDDPRKALFAGFLYTMGRTIAYVALGVLLVSSLLSAPALSHALQKYMNLALGPLLILVGMVLLELLSFKMASLGFKGDAMQKRIDRMGVWGAGALGLLFALSFCPVSAALFFGSLLPLALKQESGILLPTAYGIATGLPVMIFASLIAFGANKIANAYNRVVVFERWARHITGVIFIFVGIYFCLTLIFGFSL